MTINLDPPTSRDSGFFVYYINLSTVVAKPRTMNSGCTGGQGFCVLMFLGASLNSVVRIQNAGPLI